LHYFLFLIRTFLKVDLQKLLDNAAGAKKASMFEDFVNLLGGNWARVWSTDYFCVKRSKSRIMSKLTFPFLFCRNRCRTKFCL
jgi:hypothetical protein